MLWSNSLTSPSKRWITLYDGGRTLKHSSTILPTTAESRHLATWNPAARSSSSSVASPRATCSAARCWPNSSHSGIVVSKCRSLREGIGVLSLR